MPLILGTNSIKDTGYDVANSLRFDDGSSDTLTRTVSSAGNRKTFTYSVWIKRGIVNAGMGLFGQGNRSSSDFDIRFESDGKIRIEPSGFDIKTNALHRDPSAWYHIVVAIDTTQSTSSDRVKMYINGNQVTSFATATYPSLNYDTVVNSSGSTGNVVIGDIFNSTGKFDGYMAEAVLIDGQQLDATSFGEFDEDTGIWKPIDVSGLTFGTNGFYLDFENSGSLGADVSGNGNNFTVNNLTSIDQSTDTCTNNFATWNPLDNFYSQGTFSDGNTTQQGSNTPNTPVTSTFGVSTGKWYCEIEADAKSGSGDVYLIGILSEQVTSNNEPLGQNANDFAYYASSGQSRNNNTLSSYGNTYTAGDVIGIALDLDNNKLYFSKNGTWQNSGDPESGATGTGAISITDPASTSFGAYFIGASFWSNTNNATFKANFGNPPFTISSGNSDGNGYGNFEYAVPSGYYALNTKNLAEYG